MNDDHNLLRDYGAIEPGEYDCEWTINGVQVRGQVELRAGQPPTGHARAVLHDGSVPGHPDADAWSYPHHRDEAVVRGFIESQDRHVTIIDARLTAVFTDRVLVAGRIALVTKNKLPDDATFTSMSMQVTKLDHFSGLAPLAEHRSLNIGGPPYTFGATSTNLKREWTGHQMTATFWYGYRSAIDPFMVSVKFTPWVDFTSSTPLAAGAWIREWCRPLAELISVASGNKEEVTLATLKNEGKPKVEAGIFSTLISQEPYYCDKRSSDVLAFTAGDSNFSLVQALELWNQLRDEGHPLITGYNTVATGSDQHPQARFLLLLQWLEGSYGFDHRHEFKERQTKHSAVRVALMEKLQALRDAGELTSQEFRMAKRLPRQSLPSLGEALHHYFELHTAVDTEKQLRRNAVVSQLMATGCESVIDALRILRNDLSHGTKTYDPNQLLALVEPLHLLVRAEYLRLLGGSLDSASFLYR